MVHIVPIIKLNLSPQFLTMLRLNISFINISYRVAKLSPWWLDILSKIKYRHFKKLYSLHLFNFHAFLFSILHQMKENKITWLPLYNMKVSIHTRMKFSEWSLVLMEFLELEFFLQPTVSRPVPSGSGLHY
jgi:hypothetical protein